MFHPKVHQLVLEEGNNPTNDLLSIHYRRLRRLRILVRLPPLAPRRDLLARLLLHSPLASSVLKLGTTPMLVRRGTPTHQLKAMFKARNRLRLPARGSVLLESTKSLLMLKADIVDIAIGRFYINSVPAAILFDSGATHSFVFDHYVNTNELPLQTMQNPMIVITPKGPIEANYMTNRLTMTIMGRDFWSMPIVLEESNIDLILGMSWLRKAKGVIQCARGIVELTSPKGEKFEVMITITPSTRPAIYLVEGKFVGRNIRVVREFPDVFLEELPRMPPDREVEFVIDLLLGTAPISKRPYRMSVEELKELKKQLKELQEAGYIRLSSSP
jgi:hypothetical protein